MKQKRTEVWHLTLELGRPEVELEEVKSHLAGLIRDLLLLEEVAVWCSLIHMCPLGERQTWEIDYPGVCGEDIDLIADALHSGFGNWPPVEWPLLRAFTSDKYGSEAATFSPLG